ncbi:PepSY domain-containing protein [Bacillaceae bacterium W0354]
MNKEKLIWMLGGAIITIVIFILAQQFVFGTTSAEQLTENEAKEIVLSTYQGQIEEVIDEGETFSIKIELNEGTYIVLIDKHTGDVEDIKLIKVNQNNGVVVDRNETNQENENETIDDDENDNDTNDNIQDDDVPNEEDEKIEKDAAEKIAKDSEHGEITNSQYVEEKDEKYYRVEIENDQEIVTLKINALTGEITARKKDNKEQSTLLTEDEAVQIALGQVTGEIDDIDMRKIDGTIYFLIEIETIGGLDAVVQVNGITGKTTILWEDIEDDEDDEGQDES